MIGLTKIVEADSIMKVLETTIPTDFMEMNKKALEMGFDMGDSQS